jgi:mono/diheme cytochrome c family protein
MIRNTLIGLIATTFAAHVSAGEPVDYLRDVKPIFAKYCIDCHGPTKQKTGLRLDSAAFARKGNDGGLVIVLGKAKESSLMHALMGEKEISKMPPEGRPQPTAAEIATIRRWIDAGAPAPKDETVAATAVKSDHWAFQPVKRPDTPAVKQKEWPRNPIDAFVLARLEKEGLTPSQDADRVTLLRRASLDLTGLPPTPAEVASFINDKNPDAYEKAVERLLKSPHYGERWARHWLDLARYADSNGFTIDGPRTIWPYRDWVIDALNRDQPIDQFIIEQLAGDMLPGATVAQKVATGFHRNTLFNQEGGIDLEMFRVEYVIDRVGTTGSVFLGLTVGCAQCHDHKYDPVSQGEFYKMFAFFNNCDEPTLSVPTALEQKSLAMVKPQEAALLKAIKGLDQTSPEKQKKWEATLTPEKRVEFFANAPRIRELTDKPDYQRTKQEADELRNFLRQADQFPHLIANLGDSLPGGFASAASFVAHGHVLQYRAGIEKKLADLYKRKPEAASTLVMQERKTLRDTFFLIKGDFTRKGAKVSPGTPAVLHPLKSGGTPNRLDFARWVADPANPLTPRVFVNRVWQTYFGLGLVETENDFGLQGTPPSHPELLDWLAGEFVARKWSLKDLHRLIVTSSTYRQSSTLRPELAKADPRNRLLGRQSRLRLEAEVVRDVALSASGLLNPRIGGPSVFPPQPDGVFAFTQTQRIWKSDTSDDRFRRGLYTYFWRSAPHPGLMAFDAPDANTSCTRRNRSNTPLQALTLLNDKAYVEFAQALAVRVLREAKGDDADLLRHTFQLCLARDPNAGELERLQNLLSTLEREMAGDVKESQRLAPRVDVPGIAPSRMAAWSLVSRALLNLDEFITRE